MKKLHIFTVMILVVAMVSCGDSGDTVLPAPLPAPLTPSEGTSVYETVPLSEVTEQAFMQSSNDFSCRLFREIIKKQEKPNVFISPLSAAFALFMTVNGAAGITEKEMLATLGYANNSVDELNACYQKLVKHLSKADAKVDLGIANSIWMKEGFGSYVNPAFLAVNQACYDAEVRSLVFDQLALDAINGWCKEKTKGCIPTILDEIRSDAVMYLINALYFKGGWRRAFNKSDISKEIFKVMGQNDIKVSMMSKYDEVCWASDETISAIELPYGNGTFNMTVLLPKQGKTMEDAITALTPENWKKWDAMFDGISINEKNAYTGKLVSFVLMPKFKLEWDMVLNDVLKTMGMSSAFDDKANFSNLAPDIFISLVKQKTFVDVTEEGTEASSSTVVEMEVTASPDSPAVIIPTMRLNRPFLFAIREKASGTILFLGKVDEPTVVK